MKKIKGILISLILVLTSSGMTTAAEFFVLPGTKTLYMMGTITFDDVDEFRDYLERQEIDTIGLAGPGGALEAAFEIGETVKEKSIKTLIIDDRDCSSACAIIFMAGEVRKMGRGSRIGIHLPFVDFANSDTTPSSYCEKFRTNSPYNTEAVREYFRQHNPDLPSEQCLTATFEKAFSSALTLFNLMPESDISRKIFEDMISTRPFNMRWYNYEEAKNFNLISDQ